MVPEQKKKLLFGLLLILSFSLFCISESIQQPAQWSEQIKVVSGITNSLAISDRSIAVDSLGNVHIVCFDLVVGVFYVHNDSGSFESIEIGPSGIFSVIATDTSNNIHIAYCGSDGSPENDYEIFYTNNIGGSFSTSIKVTSNDVRDFSPSIGIDSSGHAYIAYEHTMGSQTKIFCVNNSGGSFGIPIQISNNSYTNETFPSITVDGSGNIHIVYYGNISMNEVDILYTNSNAVYFPNSTLIESPDEENSKASIAVDLNGVAHVVFQGRNLSAPTTFEIFYVSNSKGSFETPILIDNGEVYSPSVAVGPVDDVHIVYPKLDGGDFEIYHTSNATGSFGTPTKITEDDRHEIYPSLTVDAFGYVHVIYMRLHGPLWGEICYVTTSPFPPQGILEGEGTFPIHFVVIGVSVAAVVGVIAFIVVRRIRGEDSVVGGKIRKEKK
ncbi:MAG: hypothetical protein ACFE7E_05485 [Candidatus Hodarchaeota archaeon]